jgi:hypothetical protein
VFRRGKLWRRGRIYSDEGFSVHIGGRDSIGYFEGNRKMTITVNEGNAVYEETISRWDDEPMLAKSDQEQARIADNIRRAFESQGLKVSFPDSRRQVKK